MYVYLLSDGVCKRTTRVFLDLEKCVPCVGTYKESTVDPPLWYKVLVLDSILLDCDNKTVHWSPEPCEINPSLIVGQDEGVYTDKVRAFFKTKEQMFQEKLCAELDPSQVELFETAENVFINMSPEVIDKQGNVPTYKDILKILHVYILPNIKFQKRHEHYVNSALTIIEKEYENIEMIIKMYVQSKKNIEEDLKRQRQRLLIEDGYLSMLQCIPKDRDIVHIFLTHWEKDIRQLENVLSVLADKITPLRNATDEASKEILEETREERNIVNKKKEEILQAREEIINVLKPKNNESKKCVKLKTSQSVIHKGPSGTQKEYKKKSVEVEDLSKEVKQQINIKIRLSSVRNATCLTLKEIQGGQSSYGYNRKKGSLEFESDLFDATKKPDDWITLNEHVKAYMKMDQSNLKTKHLEFCTRFKENCKALQERAKRDFFVKFGSLETGRHTLQFGNRFSDQKEQMRFSTRWLFGSITEEDCQTLCQQISDHIVQMADEIAIEIKGSGDILKTFHTKIYICYEEIVSEEIMPVVCKLLENSYTPQCEKLSAWIDKYADLELDSINSTLKSLFPVDANSEKNENQSELKRQNINRSTSFKESIVRHLPTRSFRRQRGAHCNPTPESNSEELSKRLRSTFEDFYAKLKEEDTAVSIFSKLRIITRAVQTAEGKFSELRSQNGQSSEMCADDILDILILLICRLDHKCLLKLYAHVNLILHLSPYFLQGSISEYSLVTITGAFQHLFERQEMHANEERAHNGTNSVI